VTLKARVESYIGTVSGSLDAFLQEGAQILVDLLPLQVAMKFTVRSSVPGGGLAVANLRRVLEVEAGGVPASLLPVSRSGQSVNSASLFLRTSLDPGWYIKDGTMFVVPAGLTGVYAHSVPYPTVEEGDEGILYLPGTLVPAVALYAGVQVLKKRMSDLLAILRALTTTLPTVPILPTPPTYNPGSFPTLTTEFGLLSTYLNTEEDIELAGGEMNAIKTKLDEYGVKMQKAASEMQATHSLYGLELQTYSAELGAILQNYGATTEKTLGEMKGLSVQIADLNHEYDRILLMTGIVKNDTSGNG
jgi:hypothetical protein